MESNISENVTPKLVGMIVAIIVLACVMIPICNSLVSNGNGNGGGSSSGEITASNEQYVLSKMAYGTNPTFEITPSNEEYMTHLTGEFGESDEPLCYKMAVLYADSTNLIYRLSANDGEKVYHIITDSFNTLSDATNVSTISTVVSDGQTVTVNYVDNDSNSQQYSFDIASPCYYADANGEYGLYLNPSIYEGIRFVGEPTPLEYTSLYIPNDYTPHIIGATSYDLNMAYDNGYVFGYTGGSIKNFTTYTTVSKNLITDAGWKYDIRPEGSEWQNDVINHCYFLILPNKVTYTPSNTLDNPEPYSMKYSYAEGTIPDFSINVETDMQTQITTVTTENGTVTINPSDTSKNTVSYVLLATENSFIGAFAQGIIYVNGEGAMYLIIGATIQCANGQISLVLNEGDAILDASSMSPVSGNVALGTVEWCYYANPNGDYGNYADTQIGNGLYYDSTKPLCSVGHLGERIILYRNFELMLSNTSTVEALTYVPSTSDNLFKGASWTELVENDESVQAYFTILPTSISADNGGNGGDGNTGGVSGISATIIKLLPVFVAIGLILAMVSMFYDPRELLGGQQ